jgi:hypothetical protein
MMTLATVLMNMPPEGMTRETEMVSKKILDGVEEILERLQVPRTSQIAMSTFHAEECPCYGAPSGDGFEDCTCPILRIEIGIMTEDDLKVALQLGKVRHAGGRKIDPAEAN